MIVLTGAVCPLCAKLAAEGRQLYTEIHVAVSGFGVAPLIYLADLPGDLGPQVARWHEAKLLHMAEHGNN